MKSVLVVLFLILNVYSYAQNNNIKIPKLGKKELNSTSSVPSTNGEFSYNITTSGFTSAAVYENDSFLVKTLWAKEYKDAGIHIGYWNGTNNYGVPISSPGSNYLVKVLKHNVEHRWQGIIGNTSDSAIGDQRHHCFFQLARGMKRVGNFIYYVTGYSEGDASHAKFNVNSPNTRENFLVTGNADNNYIAADATNIYFGALDANNANRTFVHATSVANDENAVTFSSGFNFAPVFSDRTYNTIGYKDSANCIITGLAVQQTGNFLFIARGGAGLINVVNKTTGAAVASLYGYTNVRALTIDNADNLWVATGTSTVTKYTVDGGGSLTSTGITLTGLQDPRAMEVNPNGTQIWVADGGSSQQIKIYAVSTGGTPLSTLGIANGYQGDATVANNKYYFSDVNPDKWTTGITFESDGSYWVNDAGNNRLQKYDSNHTWQNRIMAMGATYSVYADPNTISRLLVGALEFEIDYAVDTLTPTSGWELKKNWGATVSAEVNGGVYDLFQFSKSFVTLSNNRTYTLIRKDNVFEVFELPSTGVARATGVELSSLASLINKDGSYQSYQEPSNETVAINYLLTGFDGSNNPIWSGQDTITRQIRSGTTTIGTPANDINSQVWENWENTGRFALFNRQIKTNDTTWMKGPHLGIGTYGTNFGYLVETEKSTHKNYSGNFPPIGYFDVGNMVQSYGGGTMNIIGRSVITTYYGEFWKNSQTNFFNHYYDNGLAIGQFGRAGYNNMPRGTPQMAGNALTVNTVKHPSGNLYVYHGDESHGAGAHRWIIEGMSTVQITNIPINYPSTFTPPTLPYINLMAGLAFDTVLVNGANWFRYPSTNYTGANSNWNVLTSAITYDTLDGKNSLRIISEVATGDVHPTRQVQCDLGTINVANDWKFTLDVQIQSNVNNQNQQFLEILDQDSLVIANFYLEGSFAAPTYVRGNGQIIDSDVTGPLELYASDVRPLVIEWNSGGVTFTYGDYAPVTFPVVNGGADANSPKIFRYRSTGNQSYGQQMSIGNLHLYLDQNL